MGSSSKRTLDCRNCIYFIKKDHGYSNYTVEGTELDCLLDLNKSFPKEEEYDSNSKIYDHYIDSNNCDGFEEGEYWECDVDGESPEPTDNEILQMKRDYIIKKTLE
jgi:hypothetical protein